MSMRSHTQTKTPTSFTLIQTGILQRKCASCGQHMIAGGECAECQNKGWRSLSSGDSLLQRHSSNQAESSEVPPIVHEVLRSPGKPQDLATPRSGKSRFARDFSRVAIHTDEEKPAPQAHSVPINGKSAIASVKDLEGLEWVAINDAPQTPSTPTPIQSPPPAPTCPTNIRVAEVGTLQLVEEHAEQGWLTGWGGYAKMEVSDPTGRNWNGTPIHENVEPFSPHSAPSTVTWAERAESVR